MRRNLLGTVLVCAVLQMTPRAIAQDTKAVFDAAQSAYDNYLKRCVQLRAGPLAAFDTVLNMVNDPDHGIEIQRAKKAFEKSGQEPTLVAPPFARSTAFGQYNCRELYLALRKYRVKVREEGKAAGMALERAQAELLRARDFEAASTVKKLRQYLPTDTSPDLVDVIRLDQVWKGGSLGVDPFTGLGSDKRRFTGILTLKVTKADVRNVVFEATYVEGNRTFRNTLICDTRFQDNALQIDSYAGSELSYRRDYQSITYHPPSGELTLEVTRSVHGVFDILNSRFYHSEKFRLRPEQPAPQFSLEPIPQLTLKPVANSNEVFRRTEALDAQDPLDRVRVTSRCKIFPINLETGVLYQIDMVRPANTPLDPFLRLEDAGGTQLASDDDGGGFPNARIRFRPTATAEYRIIATSFAPAFGPFTITVKKE